MSKILIIGASGFLGSKLYSMINAEHEVIGTYQAGEKKELFQLDITDWKLGGIRDNLCFFRVFFNSFR